MKNKSMEYLMLAMAIVSLISAVEKKPEVEIVSNVQIVSHTSKYAKDKPHFITEALADTPSLVINKITPNEEVRRYEKMLDDYENTINNLDESASIEEFKISNELLTKRKLELDNKKKVMIEEKTYLQAKRNEIQNPDFKYEHIFIKSLNTPKLDNQRIEMIRYIEQQKKMLNDAIHLVNSAKSKEDVDKIAVYHFTKPYQVKEIMALKNKRLEELSNK